jgi:large subunit ribosomal protein L10
MKKLGVIFKETSEKIIKENIKEAGTFFIVKYSGVSSPAMSNLRMSLRSSRADLFVVKNTVARRALKSAGLDGLLSSVDGPCGMVFVRDEPVGASKVLCTFAKDNDKLKLEGGIFNNKIIAKKDIETMAKLPSKEVLRAQVVMALVGPISGFVISLNQILTKFVICLDQIKEKKQTK